MRLSLLPLSAISCSACDGGHSKVIYVDCVNGSSSEECGTRKEPCSTFALAAGALQNNTCISIPTSRSCPLNQVVNITGYSNIEIAGNAGLALVCTGKNAGLYVAVVENLKLVNVTFRGCSALHDSASVNVSSQTLAMAKIHVALYIINVTDLTLQSTHFHSTSGMGLAVYNTNGNVSVTDCEFVNNFVRDNESVGGGGMLVHYSFCTPGLTMCDPTTNIRNRNNNIVIDSCHFEGNRASNSDSVVFHREKGSYTYGLGEGGGMAVVFSGNSSSNTVLMQNLVLYNNSAQFGGGIEILLKDNAKSNIITIQDTMLEANRATDDGGGLRIAIEFYECSLCASENSLLVRNTRFLSNSAAWGGAIEYFSSRGKTAATNNISFYDCTWDSNSADVSAAAVDIALNSFNVQNPTPLPTPLFHNCTFVNNILRSSQTGVVSVQSYVVQFSSNVTFKNNTGSALYLTDATAALLNGTVMEFISNTANTGAAVSLMGSSTLEIHPDTYLNFTDNRALEFGGAIYFYSTSPSLFYSYTCFIKYFNGTVKPGNWSNVHVWFVNNTAVGFGQAMYASTLLPCARAYGDGSTIKGKLATLFTKPPFYYFDPYTRGLIGTVAHRLNLKGYIPLVVVPGKVVQTGVRAYDELDQLVDAVIHVVVIKGFENASIASTYSYTADGNIRLTGMPLTQVELTLQTTGPIQAETRMELTLSHCPPGFYADINKTNLSSTVCKCSAHVPSRQYGGVFRCDADDFQAILSHGYWGGCLNGSEFVTGQCPLGFCNDTTDEFILPQSCEELDDQLCGAKHRTGVLCGQCKENYTVHYHSNRYACQECKYPELGLLFYALAELLPLTLLFVVIVMFGISFTSGPANSFIFFAQVLNFFDVTSFGSLPFPKAVAYLTYVYQPIFGAFNFDFFKGDIFSFCLWENAKILDLFVFKYITTVYVMVILLVLILAIRFIPRCHSCLQRCVFRRNLAICLIQGMSALLIISYAQCAKVSFEILTVQSLRGEGLHSKKSVVFLSGETNYLGPGHLPYAIPAMLVLILSTVPPFILIIHPTITKLCRKRMHTALTPTTEEESERVSYFSVWNTRLVHLFDSFQGCFKDNCRYFAGLYFIYRLAIAMAFALADNGMELYFTLEVIIIVMLALHAIIQPYQNPFFNVLDAAVFADLAIINGLSMYNFYWAQYGVGQTVNVVSSIQVTLIYLPLIYMAVMVLLKAGVRFARIRRLQWLHRLNHYIPLSQEHVMEYRPLERSSSFSENHLPARLFEEDITSRSSPSSLYRSTNRHVKTL